MQNKETFLKEFKDLLAKYEVSIDFSVGPCSDTYGLYDDTLTLRDKDNNIIFDSNGNWWIDQHSFKE